MKKRLVENKKNIYKKSVAMELIKRDNNFLHSMRNRDNSNYQVWVFEDTKKLRKDLAELTDHEYVADECVAD